ncbi:MAG: hypothetical protein WC376_00240 [Candidatus Nanoarchaeia archaeon]|jgi:hypothetical protein
MSAKETSPSGLATIIKYGYQLGIFPSGTFLLYESKINHKGKKEYVVSDKKDPLDIMPENVFKELSDVLINYIISKK